MAQILLEVCGLFVVKLPCEPVGLALGLALGMALWVALGLALRACLWAWPYGPGLVGLALWEGPYRPHGLKTRAGSSDIRSERLAGECYMALRLELPLRHQI